MGQALGYRGGKRQLGTETTRLQREIRQQLARMNWSQKRFAREIQAWEEPDEHSDKGHRHYEERLKKHLSRPSTPPERLLRYLELLQHTDDFNALQTVVPIPSSADILETGMANALTRLSRQLDDL